MMLSAVDLKKYFGGIKAVDGCSFQVAKGSITALIGPNGCGKTTTFNLISGFLRSDAGHTSFRNQKLPSGAPHRVAQQGISRTFQHPRLFANLSVAEHVRLALTDDDHSFWKSLFSSKDVGDDRISEVLDRVGFNNDPHTKAEDLSYGQRKLLDLALAVARPHHILLLDEPVAGVNPTLREQIKELLVSLREEGETVLLIEHDMNFVMELADTVHVMNQGSILTSGAPEEVREDDRVLEAYLGS